RPEPPGATLTTLIPSRSGAAAKSASVTPNSSHALLPSLAATAITAALPRGRGRQLRPDLVQTRQHPVQGVIHQRRHAAPPPPPSPAAACVPPPHRSWG